MGWCPLQRGGWPLLLLGLFCWSSTVFAAAPSFDGTPPYSVSIAEDVAVGYTVMTLSATDDVTPSASLAFSLVTTTSQFEIVSPYLKVKAAFDLDVSGATSVYTLTVRVTDGNSETTDTTVTVTVTNVNDEVPVIDPSATTTANVAEGQSAGTSVTFSSLTATDSDEITPSFEKLTYSLEGTDSSVFHIDSLTGAITTAQMLDRETKAVYDQLVFKVSDEATPPHTATVSLTVSVTDINDVTPTCSPSVYYVSVNENTGSATSMTTLTCTDTDDSVNGDFDPSIYSGDPGSVFQFAASGLELQTGTTATDYETAQSYELIIHLIDKPASGTPNTGTATVIVTVVGQNDNNPAWATWTPGGVFTSGISIDEDTAIGTSLFTVSATDADVGVGGSITYSLDSVVDSASSTAVGVFRIDSVSGEVSTLQTLDRDGGITSYTVTVKADDGGASPLTQAVTVTLNDVNDNTPAFTSTSYSTTLAESAATTGASLVLVTATDADTSPTFTYTIDSSLQGNPSSKFQFSGTTAGQLELAAGIDLDTGDDAVTVLQILVTDGGSPTVRTGTARVTVTITPTNDHTPAFGATTPGTSPIPVAESVGTGTSVATVTATDSDTGSDGDITYSITGGNTNNAFTIGSNGEVRTLTALDYETTTNYNLVVMATDGGSSAKSATISVSISITNDNDNVPVCTSYYIAETLAEDASVNDAVTTLSCTDADGDTLSYTFSSGNEDSKFSLNSGTGAITLADTVNYDSATQSYTLHITVSDLTNSQSVVVKVTLTAVNQATPAFASNPTQSVSESEAAGYAVITYTATDSDYSPHDIDTYAITAVTQSGSSKFTIDQSSGAIRLLAPLDYEALPSGSKTYELTVTATDGGGLVGTGTVTVSVVDVNDNSPTCGQTSWSVTVAESESVPLSVVGSLGCTDAESGTTLTYVLTENPVGSLFSETSGGVQLDSTLDYETSTSHVITVVVTDAGSPPASTTVFVNVFVQDVNDGAPTFSGTFDVTKAENIAVGTSIADVTASDPDGTSSAFGNPQYSIISGDTNGDFLIDAATGRVTTQKALDADTTQTYNMVIKALEEGGTNSATVTLTVTVSDVNDVTPSCTFQTFTATVAEPGTVSDTVVTLTCSDADVTATTLAYTITSGDTTKFTMNSNVLELAATLDYESGTTQYSLTISVSDGANSVDVTGSVIVGPVNESPPVFSISTYSVTKSEALAVSSTIVQVLATDADSSNTADGVVIYGFDSTQTLFTIDSSSGDIVLASSLDRETLATHTIQVTASDGTTVVTATVSLTVSDENDNAPVFTQATYTTSVSETDASGAAVVTVTANDADDAASNNNVIVYSITGGDTNGHFTINVNTGAITTATQLDADAIASYTLTVTAKDRSGGAGSLSSSAQVLVTVTSVNQHDPVFTQSTYSQSVDESVAVGYQVVQVIANDADSGSDGTVTYSMLPHTYFTLAADGWISVKTALDYETLPNTFTFDVVATDGGTSARSATATVTINVGDVNDNTALCNPSMITVQMREDATGPVTTLSCSDSDSGVNQQLTYTISTVNSVAGAGNFAVDGSGAVTVSALDYETNTALNVVILVADQGTTPRTTTVYLTVTVTDVNENDPAFSGTPPFSANVAESEAPGFAVLTVAATDADDSDVITYSLDDTTYIEVDSNTGAITLKSQFDYETTPTHTVNVCATDSNTVDAIRSTCVSLTITVTDVNDNDPVFSPNVYSGSVDENAANGQTVVTVTAADADTLAAGSTITYSIPLGNTNNVFRVDTTGGHVIVDDNTNLDYETTTSFTLTVRAEDGGGRSADATVTITVNPLNEVAPAFTPTSSTETVAEDAAPGSIVTITAADTDSGSDGTLTYSIASGDAGTFSINPSTGEVSLVAGLDRETTQQYILTILATDAGTNPSAKTGTYTLTIDVTDVNDVTPSCSATFYAATIPEDAAVSDSVTDISCSDGDQDPANLNNDLTYTITNDPTPLFAVDTSGRVTVATASFDRETTSSYTLTLEVADKATTGKLTATVTLQVDLTDVNDNDPVFAANPYTPTVPENSAVGFTLETVVASDSDTGSNAALTFSLTSATPAGKFAVDPQTGDVTVAAALDYETDTAYTLVVTATDQGASPRSQSTTVSVTVSDVDDNPPVCASSLYTATLAEDANPATATVVTVSCPDVDTASVVTYSLTNALFSVDSSTGVVSLTGGLDYETAQVHTMTVTASDGARTDTTTVQVIVTDVNEFDPTFDPTTPYTASVPEDSPIGFTVKDVGASDSDLSDTTLTYTMTGGSGKFTIDSVTGVIALLGTLDRETTSSYTLDLEVADGSGGLPARTSTTSIVVTVTDVNDNDPTCTQTSYVATVAEGTTSVLTISCSDVDTSTPTVQYTLLASGNTGTAFGIDANTGVLSVVGSVDYETLSSYSLVVEVDDKDTPTARTTTVPVTVTVTPVNEATPAFPAGGYSNTDVVESTAVGSVVLTVSASDTDTGLQHGTVRYSIVAGDTQGDFAIDSSNGEISVAKPLDREGAFSSYSLTVRASDDVAGSGNELSSDVAVGITITDTNDNYPVFSPASYTTTILETAAVSGTVITVTATDADAGTNAALTLSVFSGNTNNAFSMSGFDLILDNALDYETTKSYDLVIQAVDGGSPTALTSQARISIVVGAVNEDAPVLTDTTYTATIPEDQALGTLIYTAVASDTDQDGNNDGTVTYSITSGDTNPNSFIVDPNSGEVRVFSRLDYDTAPQTYTLTLVATDGGGLTDTATLTLSLSDVNDHTPQFSATSYTTNLDENVVTSTSVFTVTATDNDSGVNGQIAFSITDGNGQSSFAIDGASGEVTTTAAIDYEATPILYLVVQALDGGTPPLSSTALLRINVVDLNDNPPVVVPDDFAVTWPEDVAANTQVASVAATDADSAANNNNVVVFSLTSADFSVDPSTGAITTSGNLDREANPSGHVLTVVATDQGSNPAQNTVSATVTILLSDVNDNDPVVTGPYDITAAEDTGVGSILFQITATDADIGDNGRLTYTIVSGNTNTDLNIIDTNGMVQVGANGLDRETTDVYNLEIRVADNGSPTARSVTVTATLTVSDVNDNDPAFTGTPYAFSVAENSVVGVLVGTVAASDIDTGLNANLVYSIQNFWAGDSTHFVLDAATGEIDTAVTTLDRETRDTYSIWCRVNDQGTPQRYADVNVTITITDINDNPPIFSAATYTGTVAENTAVDTSILTVTATDADIGTNADITYAIDTSTTAGARARTFLKVESATGKVKVKANIDYETDTSFTFEITATDGGTPAFTATTTVTVTVTDVNDNSPYFTSTFFNSEVAYGGQCSNAVAQPVCQDVDSGLNGQVTCYLVASTYDYLFHMSDSCALTTQTVASANFRYTVEAQCRDAGSPVRLAATPATVRVDTFIPDQVVVRFQLSISKADFEAQQSTFIANLQSIVRGTYSTALLRLWCVQERGGTATTPGPVPTGRRRRLLQSSNPVDVFVYALEDDSTESSANVAQAKTFLTSDQLMGYFAADASGTPSAAVQGSAWDYYGIEKVGQYTEENTPWIQTAEGIAVVSVCCVLGFLLLCLLFYFCFRCYCKRKRPVTPIRSLLVESKDGPLVGAAPAATVAKPRIKKADVPDIDKKPPIGMAGLSTTAIAATAFQNYTKKKQEQEASERSMDAQRRESVATPRTILLTQRDDVDLYPVANREFDGRALDPNTGKVYEYSTKTHERRWLGSPPGYNV
ncbi:protocadherin Fat 4-like [Babylonia areolata]|uniref:protocadherin Fat 4-like n=1 Tax=Babylonia areolata TaxID=304850 RepID=UPI003FD53C22